MALGPSSAKEVVDRLRALEAGDGKGFERWVSEHAYVFPEWEVAECWLWDDWPESDRDSFPEWPSGQSPIDLVAKKTDGSLAAIQCKFYTKASITPKQVREFSGATRVGFSESWFIAKATVPETVRKEAALLEVRILDVDEACANLLESTAKREQDDPRQPMQDAAVAGCVKALAPG